MAIRYKESEKCKKLEEYGIASSSGGKPNGISHDAPRTEEELASKRAKTENNKLSQSLQKWTDIKNDI